MEMGTFIQWLMITYLWFCIDALHYKIRRLESIKKKP